MRSIKRKFHYFYKITNNINNHYYYGIHSTDDLDDGYMGSGTRLRYAYEKYGIENFTKEILKFFDTREELAKYESDIVTEVLVKDNNCYNISLGGESWRTIGTATMRDNNGNYFRIPVDDPRISMGEFVGVSKGKSLFKDCNGNVFQLYLDDPRVISGEVEPYMKNIGMYKDKSGKIHHLSVNDPKVISGEVESMNKGKLTVKDKNDKIYYVSVNDPRYLSGELKHIWCGKKHKPETIEKSKNTYKEIGHQQGEKNSQYGTCWIMKDGESKKIKKDELELFESMGWKKGRICKKK